MQAQRFRSGRVAVLRPSDKATDDVLLQTLERARFGVREFEFDAARPPRIDDVDAILLPLDEIADVSGTLHSLRLRFPKSSAIGWVSDPALGARSMIAAYRAGISDIAVFDGRAADLVSSIKLAIERQRIERTRAELSTNFTRELGSRGRAVQASYDQVESAYEDTLLALVKALDSREKATAGHSIRVAYFCCYLARLTGIADTKLLPIYRGALLHDIGKIGIPDSILLKPAALTDDEFRVMKGHTALGKRFLEGVAYLQDSVDIPYSHHERWDGGGYPQGLVANDIPLAARIFAVVDVYDALRSKRCYKPAMTHEQSLKLIFEGRGTQFDPDLVDTMASEPVEIWEQLDEASSKDPSFDAVLCAIQEILAAKVRGQFERVLV